MKKLLVLLVSGLLWNTTQTIAQSTTQGVISYNMVIQLRKQVAKQNPAIAPMVPETMTSKMKVAFKNETFVVSAEANSSSSSNVQMQMNSSGRQIINLKTKTVRDENTFNQKKYYSESPLKAATNITYTTGTKKILGYACNKALVTSDKKQYTVWYTTAIPYAYNPEGSAFAGLKCAVLESSTDEQTCTAISIDTKKFTPAAIAPDTAAKKISKEQMEDLQDEVEENAMSGKGEKGNIQQYKIKL